MSILYILCIDKEQISLRVIAKPTWKFFLIFVYLCNHLIFKARGREEVKREGNIDVSENH